MDFFTYNYKYRILLEFCLSIYLFFSFTGCGHQKIRIASDCQKVGLD